MEKLVREGKRKIEKQKTKSNCKGNRKFYVRQVGQFERIWNLSCFFLFDDREEKRKRE